MAALLSSSSFYFSLVISLFFFSCIIKSQDDIPPVPLKGVSILDPTAPARFLTSALWSDGVNDWAYLFIRGPPSFYRFNLTEFRALSSTNPVFVPAPVTISSGTISSVISTSNLFITASGIAVYTINARTGFVNSPLILSENAGGSVGVAIESLNKTYIVASLLLNHLIEVNLDTVPVSGEILNSTEPTVRLNENYRYTRAVLNTRTNVGFFFYDDLLASPVQTVISLYQLPPSVSTPVTTTSISGLIGATVALDSASSGLFLCGVLDDSTVILKINVTNSASWPSAIPSTDITDTLVIGGGDTVCNALTLDLVNGLGFAAINLRTTGSLIRFNLAKMTLVEQTILLAPSKIISTPTIPSSVISRTGLPGGPVKRQNPAQDVRNQILLVTTTDAISFAYYDACPVGINGQVCSGPAAGTCTASFCICNPGFIADDCSEVACPPGITCGENLTPSHGRCSNGICLCEPSWTGNDCQTQICPFNCNGRGTCDTSTFTCTCNFRYSGAGCEIIKLLSCADIPFETDCVKRRVITSTGSIADCGWCETENRCIIGNKEGPVNGSCANWYHAKRREIGIEILAWIFIGILGLLFICNMISALIVDIEVAKSSDSKLSADDVRKYWWRDERSNKSWLLFDQFQFMSLYIIISVFYPSRIVNFSRYFDWSNLDIPFGLDNEDNYPWRDNSVLSSKRQLLSYAQYANGVDDIDDAEVFYTTILWTAIFFFGFGILYLILAIILGLICGGMGKFFRRLIHIEIRVLLIAYTPVIFTAAYHIKVIGEPSVAGAAVALAVIGIGLPVLAFIVVSKPDKPENLFETDYKLMFGSLYGAFHYKKAKLGVLLVFGKKGLCAVFYGFLAFTYGDIISNNKLVIPQIIIPVVILIAYIVILIIVKPFLDHVHMYVEIILSVINFVCLLIAFAHLNNPQGGAEYAFFVLQCIGLMVCVGAYINSWMMMVGAKSVKEIGKICSCR